ncbi:MAG: TRAP transporter permease [Firmicutes bacterium]|nr:TRAP transporter permease [Bacillota bacterium]
MKTGWFSRFQMKMAEPAVQRTLEGWQLRFVVVLAVVASLIHIWMNSFSLMIAIKRNAIHLALMLSLTFLLYPGGKRSSLKGFSALDAVLAVLSAAVGLYLYFVYDSVVERALVLDPFDYVVALIAVLLVLEGARRAIGGILPVLAIVFLLYAKYGYLLSGPFAHRGFTWARILNRMYYTDEGLFGVTLMVSSSYVFMFIVFGAFLSKTGTAKFFNDFALSFAGRLRGGPAQVAVFASAIMGTISGSAQANVVTTGTFTIPLMKSIGYKPYFAGAVEAVASTGGILMPPIMGAAAFMMASFLGIPYLRVMMAGFIPALFYYFAVFLMVDREAAKLGLKGLPRERLPELRKVLAEGWHLMLPIVVIVVLLVRGLTPLYAAFFGLIATIVGSYLKPQTRLTLPKLIEALDEGARAAIGVGTSCAVVGFIVGVVAMTGLGQVIALNIMQLAMGRLWLALVLVMLASMCLGMGLPAEACYIITASVAAPALVRMGVLPLAAHFFVFYYGTLSCVIPPVALTSYTAAGIAKANPTQVALTGLKLAMAGLIIPYLFVYQPILLMESVDIGHLAWAVVSGTLGVFCLAIAAQRYFHEPVTRLEQMAMFGAAICLIDPGLVTDAIGAVLLVIGFGAHLIRTRRRKAAALRCGTCR